MTRLVLGGCAQGARQLLAKALSVGRVQPGRRGSPQPRLPLPSVQPAPAKQQRRPLVAPTRAQASLGAACVDGMEAEIEHVVERIHSTPVRVVLYLGGGGSQVRLRGGSARGLCAISRLYRQPAS